jgi:hypothetical protein
MAICDRRANNEAPPNANVGSDLIGECGGTSCDSCVVKECVDKENEACGGGTFGALNRATNGATNGAANDFISGVVSKGWRRLIS